MTKQTILVTGAGDGLGFCTSRILLERGEKLIAVVRDGPTFQRKLTEECSFDQDQLRILVRDLSKLDDVRALLFEVDFSAIDVCIQSAGTSHFGSFDSLPEEEVLSIINVNAAAPILITSRFVRKSKPGSMLINVTSIAACLPLPQNALYSAMKQALGTLTLATSREMRRKEITVLDFCPGSLATSFHKKASGKSNIPSNIAMSPERCAQILVRSIDRKTSGSLFPDLVAKIIYLATWNFGRLFARFAF
jgi:uncharacterized protein